MNNQEAIARLQVVIRGKREKIKFNKTFSPKQDNEQLEQDIEVYETAISALEKQIPKKPIKTNDETGIRYTDSYRCPNCGGAFAGTGIANFCYHCGQAIDWSDSD